MKKIFPASLASGGLGLALTVFISFGYSGVAAQQTFTPVTEMLAQPESRRLADVQPDVRRAALQPAEADHDAERRAAQEVFKKELRMGIHESIPIVYRGVMYIVLPGAGVGRSTRRPAPRSGNTSGRPAPSSTEDDRDLRRHGLLHIARRLHRGARCAHRRGEWETKIERRPDLRRRSSSKARCCPAARAGTVRDNCYISAHDAKTGKEVWRFYTAAAGEPGGETWGGAPDGRAAARHRGALPGGYDPVRRLIYWGVANPTPNTRAERHGGNAHAIPTSSPADLYSNSTVALNPDTGKLRLVLPAPAWRRLGRGLHERAHAAAHRGQSRSEVREVDQSGH